MRDHLFVDTLLLSVARLLDRLHQLVEGDVVDGVDLACSPGDGGESGRERFGRHGDDVRLTPPTASGEDPGRKPGPSRRGLELGRRPRRLRPGWSREEGGVGMVRLSLIRPTSSDRLERRRTRPATSAEGAPAKNHMAVTRVEHDGGRAADGSGMRHLSGPDLGVQMADTPTIEHMFV